ncbi:MAG: 3-deoxy-7-phosphoheptulonate synthase [Candidatus Sumerlaeia bacterium]
MKLTENVNIKDLQPLISPKELKDQYPLSDELAQNTVLPARKTIQSILCGRDKRMLAIVGPCSIHDHEAALDYAQRLQRLQEVVKENICLVMRTYFEKPRTTLGWKGLLYDPLLDGSDDISEGVRLSREILLEITRLGVPTAMEILDPIVPQYLSDLVAWVSIGARTASSQIHRQMASGLSMPIGFKNSTSGNPNIAVEAIKAASSPHAFLGIAEDGRAAVATTHGNHYGHVVLRGGLTGPNYEREYVVFTEVLLEKAGIHNGIIIDCSHANSHKDYRRQREVWDNVLKQITGGSKSISGMMLESYIQPGSQKVKLPVEEMEYGQSITDACIGWDETEELIRSASSALEGR